MDYVLDNFQKLNTIFENILFSIFRAVLELLLYFNHMCKIALQNLQIAAWKLLVKKFLFMIKRKKI